MSNHNCTTESESNSNDWLYGYDEGHGIPNVELIDIIAQTHNGRGYLLSIIVSMPLDSCKRCQSRLAQKIENYLEYINADSTQKKWGVPRPETTVIEVELARGSHPDTIVNLERMIPWAASHGASLKYELLKD